jgi:hypothetical protein
MAGPGGRDQRQTTKHFIAKTHEMSSYNLRFHLTPTAVISWALNHPFSRLCDMEELELSSSAGDEKAT